MTNRWAALLPDDSDLWQPELTAGLIDKFVSRDRLKSALISRYGTYRWLQGSVDRPLHNGGDVRLGRRVATIEYLPSDLQARFPELHFDIRANAPHRTALQAAADIIADVPGMSETIGLLVRSIHPLQSERDQDISHSTPELPFSVFLSIPAADERDATLRLAESLIHESMHLQLTLLDLVESLVLEDRAVGYSPWKDEARPLAGLLHGLYVFAVIHRALGFLMPPVDDGGYCFKRRRAIELEVDCLSAASDGLSDLGTEVWRRCRESVGPAPY